MSELVICNGTVVTPDGERRADVLVRDGVIAAIEPRLSGSERPADVVDATDAFVTPGGVDAHVHFQTPQGDTMTSDDFTSGTAAALYGGTTTVVQFCVQNRGERFAATLDRWTAMLADKPPLADVGFHLMVTDLPGGTIDDLLELPRRGVTSIKVFMAAEPAIPAGDIFRVMQVAARTGARVVVHAEDGEAIDVLAGDARREGRTGMESHVTTRPAPLETAAAQRAIEYARVTGARIYFVHVTAADTVAAIARARARGLDVVGETCPQYLLLDPTCLSGGDGARMAFTPPPREANDRAALWDAIQSGDLQVVSSDHNSFCLKDKLAAPDFSLAPQGIPGVEWRLPLLHQFGVRERGMSWSRFTELTAAGPAKALDLWPRKGALRVGSDADVVVFDPNRTGRLSAADQHMSDYSAYEGLEVTGTPRAVVIAGRLAVDDGRLLAEPGWGRFVPRETRPR